MNSRHGTGRKAAGHSGVTKSGSGWHTAWGLQPGWQLAQLLTQSTARLPVVLRGESQSAHAAAHTPPWSVGHNEARSLWVEEHSIAVPCTAALGRQHPVVGCSIHIVGQDLLVGPAGRRAALGPFMQSRRGTAPRLLMRNYACTARSQVNARLPALHPVAIPASHPPAQCRQSLSRRHLGWAALHTTRPPPAAQGCAWAHMHALFSAGTMPLTQVLP